MLVSCLYFGGCADEVRYPNKYVIPDNYTGWVEIDYEVPGTAPLPFRQGHYIVEVGQDGRLRTSSSVDYGWTIFRPDQYFYQNSGEEIASRGSGEEVGIWAHATFRENMRNGQSRHGQQFFVGTKEQWEARDEQAEPGLD